MPLSGPADCAESKPENVTTETDDPEREQATGTNSAGVLDGGVDDIGALQLWDQVMKEYKS